MTRSFLSLALVAALTGCGSDATDRADAPAAAPAPGEPTQVTGILEEGDETLGSGEYVDSYTMTADEGQFILVDVATGNFDPYVMIVSPSGEQTDVDDSESGDTSSTEATVFTTEAGEYTVMVTSYAPGETGVYNLTYSVE